MSTRTLTAGSASQTAQAITGQLMLHIQNAEPSRSWVMLSEPGLPWRATPETAIGIDETADFPVALGTMVFYRSDMAGDVATLTLTVDVT
jgi:hypothetical protein